MPNVCTKLPSLLEVSCEAVFLQQGGLLFADLLGFPDQLWGTLELPLTNLLDMDGVGSLCKEGHFMR